MEDAGDDVSADEDDVAEMVSLLAMVRNEDGQLHLERTTEINQNDFRATLRDEPTVEMITETWRFHLYRVEEDIPVVERALQKIYPFGDNTPRRKYNIMQIRRLFFLVLVKKYPTNLASRMCGVNRSTCARYIRKITQ